VSDQLDHDMTDLLEAERERPGPTAAANARLLARLDASIAALPGGGEGEPGGGAPPPGDPAPPAGPAPSEGRARAGAGWPRAVAIGATSLVLGAVGGAALDRIVFPPPPRVVYVDRVVPAASVPPPAPVSSSAAATESASAVPEPSAAKSPAAAPSARDRDHELAAERALLEVARTALGRNDPATALASLDRHAQRSPGGQLREEREALAVQALARLGRTAEMRARATQFKKVYPASMFMPVVDAALGAAKGGP